MAKHRKQGPSPYCSGVQAGLWTWGDALIAGAKGKSSELPLWDAAMQPGLFTEQGECMACSEIHSLVEGLCGPCRVALRHQQLVEGQP